MILIIKTVNGKTDVLDGGGNCHATLHGVKDIQIEGDSVAKKLDTPKIDKQMRTPKRKK